MCRNIPVPGAMMGPQDLKGQKRYDIASKTQYKNNAGMTKIYIRYQENQLSVFKSQAILTPSD